MKRASLISVVAIAGVSVLALAGCSTPEGDGGGDAEATRACVILPDSASSDRWENLDRKYLSEGLEGAGFEVDIQNAQGNT